MRSSGDPHRRTGSPTLGARPVASRPWRARSGSTSSAAPRCCATRSCRCAIPGPGEVRLRIDAIGLNRAEVNFRRGTYVEQPVLPAGLGTEAAGRGAGRRSGRRAVGAGRRGERGALVLAERLPGLRRGGDRAGGRAGRPARAGWTRSPAPRSGCPTSRSTGWWRRSSGSGQATGCVITAAGNSIGAAAIQVVRHLGAIPIVTTPAAGQRAELLAAGAADGDRRRRRRLSWPTPSATPPAGSAPTSYSTPSAGRRSSSWSGPARRAPR